jgi:transposase
VEHYAGHCPCCGGITLAPLPEGLEPGTPFSLNSKRCSSTLLPRLG